jgi:Uncharacterized conserved protein (DUF2190)
MAQNEAVLKSGRPLTIDYTPGADAGSGEVIPNLGATGVGAGGIVIAHGPLLNGIPGAVAIGGGIYEASFDAAIAFGVIVYWNDGTNQITATSAGNRQAGYVVKATSGAAKGWFYHQPA